MSVFHKQITSTWLGKGTPFGTNSRAKLKGMSMALDRELPGTITNQLILGELEQQEIHSQS